MLQEVFFRQDGATESVSLTFQGPLPLDHVASYLGFIAGSLQLQTRAAHFSGIVPGQVWTWKDLQSLCGPTAGTTAVSPIVVKGRPATGEREPCSAELSRDRACFRVKQRCRQKLILLALVSAHKAAVQVCRWAVCCGRAGACGP